MVSFFGFGQSADLAIVLDNEENRKYTSVRTEDGLEKCFLFYDGETVSGEVIVNLRKQGQHLEHQGIRIDFIGQIEVYYDRGNQNDFVNISKELARPGELTQNVRYRFCFQNVHKPYESYTGANVKLRYFLRVTVFRRFTDITKEMDLMVHTLASYPDNDSNIKMEVGIEDCLHIEFEYNRSRYHLKDIIVGKIYFLLVRIKIKYMEILIQKRESVGNGPNLFNESDTIAKFEIMDGAPVKGETIPIRLFLSGYELTPTMRDVGKKFSVKYFINLVLVDEEDRRYFKQQEITLWRKADKPVRKPLAEQILQSASQTPSDAAISSFVEVDNNISTNANGRHAAEMGPSSSLAADTTEQIAKSRVDVNNGTDTGIDSKRPLTRLTDASLKEEEEIDE